VTAVGVDGRQWLVDPGPRKVGLSHDSVPYHSLSSSSRRRVARALPLLTHPRILAQPYSFCRPAGSSDQPPGFLNLDKRLDVPLLRIAGGLFLPHSILVPCSDQSLNANLTEAATSLFGERVC
jgi:hypothetical protein